MMMILKKFFGFDLKDKEVENIESETPDDEETKFEITITDEIACKAEKKLAEMVKYQTETLNDYKISQEALRQKFKELGSEKFSSPEEGSIAAG